MDAIKNRELRAEIQKFNIQKTLYTGFGLKSGVCDFIHALRLMLPKGDRIFELLS